jgi:hypothetical protein
MVEAQALQRFELAAGGRWISATSIPSPDATLSTGPGGSTPLFSTDTELEPLRALDGRFGVRIAQWLAIEALVSYGASRLTARVTSDAEGAPSLTVSESIREFTVEGALVADLSARPGRRAVPFVSAGVGHLRHLHEGRRLVETGRTYHAGGGITFILRAPSQPSVGPEDAQQRSSVGVRSDVRAIFREGGVASDRTTTALALSGSLFFRF